MSGLAIKRKLIRIHSAAFPAIPPGFQPATQGEQDEKRQQSGGDEAPDDHGGERSLHSAPDPCETAIGLNQG